GRSVKRREEESRERGASGVAAQKTRAPVLAAEFLLAQDAERNRNLVGRRSHAQEERIGRISGKSCSRGGPYPAGCGRRADIRSRDAEGEETAHFQVARDQRAQRRRLGAGRRGRGPGASLRAVQRRPALRRAARGSDGPAREGVPLEPL